MGAYLKAGVGGRIGRSGKWLIMSEICPLGDNKIFISNEVTDACIWEEYTKNHWIACFRQVSCLASETYFKLLVKKKANHIPWLPSPFLITLC